MYDYNELAHFIPELKDQYIKTCLIKDGTLNYTCPIAVRLLNRAILLKEFGLEVVLPENHLCPTVTNRRTFIERIQFIMKHLFGVTQNSTLTGIDIGTGASCVYPLIGCKLNPNWNFLATDIDEEIISYAVNNIELNHLQNRIKVIRNPSPNTIFPEALISSIPNTDDPFFLLCNPPFYADTEDLESRASFKRHKSNNMTMTKSELGTELGGEVGFIKTMISESLEGPLSKSIKLFSCMLGLKDSLAQLIEHLNTLTHASFAFEPLQIKHTTRYLLYWSFTHQIPKDQSTHRLRFTSKTKGQQIIPVKEEYFNLKNYIQDLNNKYGYGDCTDTLNDTLLLKYNKWSRKSRRSPIPIELPAPIQISIEYKSKSGLIFTVDEEADWEIFLGFINHLRKEK